METNELMNPTNMYNYNELINFFLKHIKRSQIIQVAVDPGPEQSSGKEQKWYRFSWKATQWSLMIDGKWGVSKEAFKVTPPYSVWRAATRGNAMRAPVSHCSNSGKRRRELRFSIVRSFTPVKHLLCVSHSMSGYHRAIFVFYLFVLSKTLG